MSIEVLKELLSHQKAEFEILQHDKSIKSKKDALGYFKMEETVPTLIVQTERGYYALIVSGERHKIDFEQIKAQLGCQQFSLADKAEIKEKFNLEAGQVPLIGHKLPCIVDTMILKHSFVYGGTGDWYYTLKIRPQDLISANMVVLMFN